MTLLKRRIVGWFDWLLPKAWRERREANPELNDVVLARLSDSDPVYRLLMDHARSNLEKWTVAALEPKLEDRDRAYHAGQAFAMLQYLQGVESTRERLKEHLKHQEERAVNRARERAAVVGGPLSAGPKPGAA